MASAPLATHVAAASLNQTVGDWVGNQDRIERVITATRTRGARFLVLPEMCLPGYSLGDRLMMRGTLDRSWKMLEELLPKTMGMVVLLGLPIRHRDVLYNAIAVCANGCLVGLVPKENLANGDVQYENRWFSGWPPGHVETFYDPNGKEVPLGMLLFEANGIGRFGVEVCEDGWMGLRPGSIYALSGAHLMANPSASWFTLGKHAVRRRMVEQISREDKVVYLYTSLLGCDATRLVFDGSVFIAQDGAILKEGRRFLFKEDFELVDRIVDLAALERARQEEGSWRQQVASMQREDRGPLPKLVVIEGVFGSSSPPPAPPPYWLEPADVDWRDPSLTWLSDAGLIPRAPNLRDLSYLELELALCMSLREYIKKCGIPGFALALSGGRDSAMCALLVARMYHYDQPELNGDALKDYIGERFTTAYMATENSGSATEKAAKDLAHEIGATFYTGDIQAAVDTHLAIIKQMTGVDISWDNPAHDVPLQNVQARLRGSLIWTIANLRGLLLIATSNKSEAAVGYTTMDGDTSGGVSPIADVPKSMVITWLNWAAEFHDVQALRDVAAIPATAELRPPDQKQTDEDDLMPFPVLDRLIFHFVQRGQDPVQMFQSLWPEMTTRYRGNAQHFADHIEKFVKLFCRAQWKRERFAISFRVTAFDLDPKTGFRFPPVQDPFTEELADLRAYVAQIEAQ